jgi:hypothetical protein
LDEWREAWRTAAAAPDRHGSDTLRGRLEGFGLAEEDIEIEREMLEGLEHAAAVLEKMANEGLPTVATGHRVVGADVCHFSAPASMPDDPAQPSGRLFLTNTRAIFVGGAKSLTLRWHMLGDPAQIDRDLVLVRADGESLYRFRLNSFGEAMEAACLARALTGSAARARRSVARHQP